MSHETGIVGRGKFLNEIDFLHRKLDVGKFRPKTVVVYNGCSDCIHIRLFAKIFHKVSKWYVFMEPNTVIESQRKSLSSEDNIDFYDHSIDVNHAESLRYKLGGAVTIFYMESRVMDRHTGQSKWEIYMREQQEIAICLKSQHNMLRIDLWTLSCEQSSFAPAFRGEMHHIMYSPSENTRCILYSTRVRSLSTTLLEAYRPKMYWYEALEEAQHLARIWQLNARSDDKVASCILENIALHHGSPKKTLFRLLYYYMKVMWPKTNDIVTMELTRSQSVE